MVITTYKSRSSKYYSTIVGRGISTEYPTLFVTDQCSYPSLDLLGQSMEIVNGLTPWLIGHNRHDSYLATFKDHILHHTTVGGKIPASTS